ncbi:Pho80p cyclin [Friedmanniomyces endolithicus]|nr:Pho80p cyclin [Friedmanniomyces endolithicus]KAK0773524.1 Pho80p cyclin [Friedmanniomyces endolithicus]KAK0777571.1 Pho80p cyclin [Friedmanniomyces endolithicus]KAK0780346.1 Pho80p cyclin [Friedmanniomyces endolithicus]KAK0837146.1 Pho80p cyclin [Friedmanniomyces endolithicus]
MSTLTSSPSPAASPRNVFYVQQRHHSISRSPRQYAPSASPKRTFNAPGPARSAPRPPIEHFVENGPVVGTATTGYVDAGTQYSPEGYPPTAGRTAAEAAAHVRKRKGDRRTESPHQQQPMHTSDGASTESSTVVQSTSQVPSEPDLRRDPSSTAASSYIKTETNDLSERTGPSPPADEPQEARSTHGHSSAPKRSRPSTTDTITSMPKAYETSRPKDLGILISNMLMELIRLNDQIPLRDGRLTRFHSRAPPGISVSDYLQRLIQHATLSPPIMLSMVYYIDRLCALYPAFTINSLTVHRFLITAATVAAKGLSDSFWTNPTYARIGGIPVSELATLELEFLQKVHWKIVPKPEILEEYYRSLVERTEGFELEGDSEGGSSSSSLDEGSVEAGDGDVGMAEGPT